MFGTAIAAISGAIAGGLIQGIAAAKANERKAKAYREAASRMKAAAEEYSGKKLYDRMKVKGNDMAYKMAMASEQPFTQNSNPGQTNNLMNMASQAADLAGQNANAAGVAGRQLGQNIEQGKNAALYNAEKTKVDQMLQQADIDYKASMQTGQELANAAGGLIGLGGKLGAGAYQSAKEYKASQNK